MAMASASSLLVVMCSGIPASKVFFGYYFVTYLLSTITRFLLGE